MPHVTVENTTPVPPRSRVSPRVRRVLGHLLLALVAAAISALVWRLFPKRDLLSRLSIASAYAALAFLMAVLLLGPINVLRRRPNPVSFNLRRDLGIWAGILAVLHAVIGLNVHLRGRPWLYFVDQHHRVRHDLFGFGNDTGTLAALFFLFLLLISNDISLRRFGSHKWKSLQRWTYAAVALTLLHALAYQNVEKRQLAWELLLWCAAGLIATFQFAGWRKMKHSAQARTSGPL